MPGKEMKPVGKPSTPSTSSTCRPGHDSDQERRGPKQRAQVSDESVSLKHNSLVANHSVQDSLQEQPRTRGQAVAQGSNGQASNVPEPPQRLFTRGQTALGESSNGPGPSGQGSSMQALSQLYPADQYLKLQKKLNELGSLDPGSKPFLAQFVPIEHRLFDINRKFASYWNNGYNYMEKMKTLNRVHLFKSTKGLDFKCPKDLNFTTVPNYLFPYHTLGFNDSETQDRFNGSIQYLLDKFAEERHPENPRDKKGILNSLTHVFTDDRLYDFHELPGYVRERSIVGKLTQALESRYYPIGTERPNIEKKMLKEMPQYERFFFMSMKGCLTDVHIDFSGSSVYNYVAKGQKVFYLVKFTTENFEIFQKHQMSRDPRWLAEIFADQWERVVVDEGQVIFVPSGYIHFVYTPIDTIMISGNFITEEDLERQIKITRFEEREVKQRDGDDKYNMSHMYEKFWDVLWAYCEYCLIPEITAAQENANRKRLRNLAEIFLAKVPANNKIHLDWYTPQDKERVQKRLKAALDQLKEVLKRTNDPAGGTASKKSKVEGEEEEEKDEEEEEYEEGGDQVEQEEDLEPMDPYGNGPVWRRWSEDGPEPEEHDF